MTVIRGLYTAAAGMLTQQHRQDLLTNNLANINTPGFKSKQGMIRGFPEVLINAVRMPYGQNKALGTIDQGVFLEESVPNFDQGDIVDTGVSTHMAIWDKELQPNKTTGKQPKLFFTLEDKDRNHLYTRSGIFSEDASGQLVTPEGNLVVDNWGFPIKVNGRSFTMNNQGVMTFSDGEQIQVGITKINDTSKLINKGNQMFQYNGDVGNLPLVGQNDNYKLLQGEIERSNVDPSQTMVDMMTALRMYEANQKVIQSIDSTLSKAVNEVGKV